MAALLQTQLDAEPTVTSDDFHDIINPVVPTITNAVFPTLQPALDVSQGNTQQAILQRLSELETMIKDGFGNIMSKLSNTVVSAAHAGGKRRTKKNRRSKMRSKQSSNIY